MLGSNGTENSAKAFSFLKTRLFVSPAVVPVPLATPSAPLGDSAPSAPVTARPTHGGDVLEDHSGLPLSLRLRIIRLLAELIQVSGDSSDLRLAGFRA